jgi:hypothetical protein
MKYHSTKAGCEDPASSAHVDVKSGKPSLKKYWTPTEKECGYHSVSMPALPKRAISTPEHSGGAKQSVKGKMGKRAPSEAKPAAGRKQ